MAPPESSVRRGRPRRWTPERIEAELRAVANGRGVMPSARELDRLGRQDLRSAIVSYGGVRYWADRLGLQMRPRQLGPINIAEEALERQARTLIEELGYLPGANKLRQLGHRELALAVLHAGGARAYCEREGLPYRDGRCSAIRGHHRCLPSHT